MGTQRTIRSLGLDLEAAEKGRTWELLPKGFRDQSHGSTYPLPTRRLELQKLAALYIPPNKRDAGCLYIRRATEKWKQLQQRAQSALLNMGRKESAIEQSFRNYNRVIRKFQKEAREAVDKVREEAQQAIASLNDLFALARRGLDGQMRAHLAGDKWPHADDCRPDACSDKCKGEVITAAAFRQCFSMVTRAVKGLGLPSDQRAKADEAIMEELAASMRDTQETVALQNSTSIAPGTEPETEH